MNILIVFVSVFCIMSTNGQKGDGVVFSSGQSNVGSGSQCKTIGGPSGGQSCVFPFKYNGRRKSSCITDNDPEGRAWCSTLVDPDGNHVIGGGNWAHCGSSCPGYVDLGGGVPSAPVSSSFTVQASSCQTRTRESGTCRIPSTCVGVTLDFIDRNPCALSSDETGVCCVDINNNIRDIIDAPAQTVDIPSNIRLDAASDIFRRSGSVFQGDQNSVFASEEAADDVDVNGGINFVDDTSPTEFHLRFNTPRKDIVSIDQSAQELLEVTKRLKDDNNLSDLQASIGLRNNFNSDTSNEINEACPWTPAPSCRSNARYRSIDGSCNNLRNSNFGRTGTPFQRILLPEYAEGSLDLPRRSSLGNGVELPSAREVSNNLVPVGKGAPIDSDNTVLVMQMGQFIDHDITHTPNHGIQCCGRNGAFPRSFDAEKCFPIRMSSTDPFWKGKKTCMNFARSLASPSLTCGLQTREQLNQITHWLDGSNIYGSTEEEAKYLRSSRGQLKISKQRNTQTGSLPSCAAEPAGKVTGCDVCGGRKKDCFFAGDFRVNEQLNLIVLHTLFMREHNRIAVKLANLNNRWNDEKIYQEARRINIAQYQHIIFKEWLPIIIGNTFMKSYGLFPLNADSDFSSDYSENFDPRINNEFAAAAYRFGHSMIPSTFSSLSKGRTGGTTLNMREVFFKPASLKNPGFLDGLVRGMTQQGSSLWDSVFIEDIRNHLFESSPGRGGLDLVAVNVQRGRDHGLPGYNQYREICMVKGGKAREWSDLRSSMDPQEIEKLKRVYRSVDDIDLYVGGFLEAKHEDSILGPVFKCIIGDQFARLKKGDRYFYDVGNDSQKQGRDHAFSLPQLKEIRKTSMARIICDNTDGVDRIQPLAFKMATNRANAVRQCTESSIPSINMQVFQEFNPAGR